LSSVHISPESFYIRYFLLFSGNQKSISEVVVSNGICRTIGGSVFRHAGWSRKTAAVSATAK
jgi:hypothetical protein